MGTRTIEVAISLPGARTTLGRATVVDRSPIDRILRAGRALLLLWAIALGCVFIPAAHFVLVPAFAAAGVVLAIYRLMEGSSLIGASGLCPRCEVERKFPPSGKFREGGGTIHCEGCGCLLEVRALEAGSRPAADGGQA